MSKIRLKVDLSDFYKDHRKKAFVCIRPEYAKIKCLEKYIKKIFSLNDIAITSLDGTYFPSEESIDIIEADDVLKIVPLSTDISNDSDKPKKKKKKDKHLQIELDHATEANTELNVSKIRCLEVTEKDSNSILGKNCFDIPSKEIVNPENNLDDAEDPISSTTIKKKRKRVRKKKTDDTITEITPPPLKTVKTKKDPPHLTLPQTGNKHIRFEETNNTEKCEVDDKIDVVKKAPIIKWRSMLEKIDKTIPRVIHAKVISRSCIKETVNVEAANFVTFHSAEIANSSNQLNMCHLSFLKENGNSETLVTTKSFLNGGDISCS